MDVYVSLCVSCVCLGLFLREAWNNSVLVKEQCTTYNKTVVFSRMKHNYYNIFFKTNYFKLDFERIKLCNAVIYYVYY